MIHMQYYTGSGGDQNGHHHLCCSIERILLKVEFSFPILVLNFASNLYNDVMAYTYRHTTMLHFSFLRQQGFIEALSVVL